MGSLQRRRAITFQPPGAHISHIVDFVVDCITEGTDYMQSRNNLLNARLAKKCKL
jgi:hypothetical protein